MERKEIEKIKKALINIAGKDINVMLVAYDPKDDTAGVMFNGECSKIAEAMFYTIMQGGKVGEDMAAIIRDVTSNLVANDEGARSDFTKAIDEVEFLNNNDRPN